MSSIISNNENDTFVIQITSDMNEEENTSLLPVTSCEINTSVPLFAESTTETLIEAAEYRGKPMVPKIPPNSDYNDNNDRNKSEKVDRELRKGKAMVTRNFSDYDLMQRLLFSILLMANLFLMMGIAILEGWKASVTYCGLSFIVLFFLISSWSRFFNNRGTGDSRTTIEKKIISSVSGACICVKNAFSLDHALSWCEKFKFSKKNE